MKKPKSRIAAALAKNAPADITFNPGRKPIPESTQSQLAAKRIARAGGGRVGQKAYFNHR